MRLASQRQTPTATPAATAARRVRRHRSGGARDYRNSWDFFDPTKDGRHRVNDIMAVIARYNTSASSPDYSTAELDRTASGPNYWNLGPPNGKIGVADVLAITRLFGHDCV